MLSCFHRVAPAGKGLSPADIAEILAQACPKEDYHGARVLLIVPDATRTAPIGAIFKALHSQIAEAASAFDVMIALGTHPPMPEAAMLARLEISPAERQGKYRAVTSAQP